MKTFPTSADWCFGILFISVSLITTESSEVVGSADPVVALAGDDVILPCSLKPNVNAEDMTVEWTGLYLKTRNVHLYRQGRDSNVEQHPSYRERTSLFNEELKNGNVSLKLTNVTLSDAGSYRCFIPTLTSQVKETTVQLFVGAVSQPVISIDGTKGWGVVLKCESGGWFPEPEMEWLDSSGTILPADGPPERHRDSEGLYTVRRHVTVNQTDTNRFTCRVHQLEINHLKETEIHVPDEVFPKSQVGLIVGLLIAVAVVVLAASAGVFMWRKHTEEKKCRKQLDEQEIQSRELLEGPQNVIDIELVRDLDVNKRKAPSSFVQNLTEQLMAAKKQIEMLSKDKYDVTRERDGLQGQLKMLSKDKYDVTRERDGLQGQLKEAKMQIEEVRIEKDKVIRERDERIENLTGEMEKLRNEKDKVIRERDEHIQNLTGEMEMLSKDKYDVTRERDGLQGLLNDVTREKDGLQGQLMAANMQNEMLSKDKYEQIQNLTGEMAKLKNEKDELNQNLTGQLEKLKNEKDEQIQNLTGEMAKLKNEKDEQIQNLTGEMAKLKNEKEVVTRERESEGVEPMES